MFEVQYNSPTEGWLTVPIEGESGELAKYANKASAVATRDRFEDSHPSLRGKYRVLDSRTGQTFSRRY